MINNSETPYKAYRHSYLKTYVSSMLYTNISWSYYRLDNVMSNTCTISNPYHVHNVLLYYDNGNVISVINDTNKSLLIPYSTLKRRFNCNSYFITLLSNTCTVKIDQKFVQIFCLENLWIDRRPINTLNKTCFAWLVVFPRAGPRLPTPP